MVHLGIPAALAVVVRSLAAALHAIKHRTRCQGKSAGRRPSFSMPSKCLTFSLLLQHNPALRSAAARRSAVFSATDERRRSNAAGSPLHRLAVELVVLSFQGLGRALLDGAIKPTSLLSRS